MRYTVRYPIWVLLIYYIIGAVIIGPAAYSIISGNITPGAPIGKSFLISITVIVIASAFLINLTLPKVIVFEDHVLVRHFLIYSKYPFKDLLYMRTVTKHLYDEMTGKLPFKIVTFYRNNKRLFSIDPTAVNAKQFIFECQQKSLRKV